MALSPGELEDVFAKYSNINSMIGSRGKYNATPDPEFDRMAMMEKNFNRAERLRNKALNQQLRNSRIELRNQYRGAPNIKLPNMPRDVPVNQNAGRGGRPSRGGGRASLNTGGQGLGGRNPRKFDRFIRSIIGQESGGNTHAVSSAGALGKYQIMPANIFGPGGWDTETVGRNVNRKQFLNHEKLQDKIAIGKLAEYFRLYGAGGAAAAWYSGDPGRKNDYGGVSSGPSVGEYVDSVIRRMHHYRR